MADQHNVARSNNEELSDLVSKAIELGAQNEKSIAVIRTNLDTLTRNVSDLIPIVRAQGNLPYRVLSYAGIVAAGVLAGLLYVVNLQATNIIAPLESKAEISIRDRAELHDQVKALELSSEEHGTAIAVLNAHNAEVEAQMNCMDVVRNFTFTTQQMRDAILAQGFKGEIPTISTTGNCRVSH